jgi:putative hydrolase of the HAD superfamily
MTRFHDIRAITFDVGNTLLHPYPTVAQTMHEVLLRFGRDVAPVDLDSQMGAFDRYYTSAYEEDESFWGEEARQREIWINGFSQVCRAVGIDRDLAEISQACYDEFDLGTRWKLFDGVVETLEVLHARGFKLGVISNWGATLESLLDEIGIGRFFDVVTASAAAGFHKPLAQAFLMTTDSLGVAPHEVVHVGDHVTADVKGCRAVGMHAVLARYPGYEDPTAGDETIEGVPVITSIEDLPGLIEATRDV